MHPPISVADYTSIIQTNGHAKEFVIAVNNVPKVTCLGSLFTPPQVIA